MERLIYISNNVVLPNNEQNPFFLQEKEWLLKRFGGFDVVCPKGVFRCEDLGELRPVVLNNRLKSACAIFAGALDPELYKEIVHMVKDKAYNFRDLLRLCHFAANTARMRYYVSKSLKRGPVEGTVLYSYWLSYDAAAVAKLKRKCPQVYALSRAHAYEIQLERYACNPYLMKNLICKYMDKIAFISKDAKKRFCSYYTKPFSNACVQYLGSDQEGVGYVARGKKETLTVLTCSSILPVKYLERMIEALCHWQDGLLHWIHVGDGTDGVKIRNLAEKKLTENLLVSYEFMGYMENKQLHEFIADDDIDVFVNCSRTEGVPVSIMEAMSVGIPVIAPKMFGIPELVREGCGLLFAQNDGYENLLNTLKIFAAMGKEEREMMGKTAYERWQKDFCLQNNLQTLFGTIRNDA